MSRTNVWCYRVYSYRYQQGATADPLVLPYLRITTRQYRYIINGKSYGMLQGPAARERFYLSTARHAAPGRRRSSSDSCDVTVQNLRIGAVLAMNPTNLDI